jgi:hypothetical protein
MLVRATLRLSSSDTLLEFAKVDEARRGGLLCSLRKLLQLPTQSNSDRAAMRSRKSPASSIFSFSSFRLFPFTFSLPQLRLRRPTLTTTPGTSCRHCSQTAPPQQTETPGCTRSREKASRPPSLRLLSSTSLFSALFPAHTTHLFLRRRQCSLAALPSD